MSFFVDVMSGSSVRCKRSGAIGRLDNVVNRNSRRTVQRCRATNRRHVFPFNVSNTYRHHDSFSFCRPRRRRVPLPNAVFSFHCILHDAATALRRSWMLPRLSAVVNLATRLSFLFSNATLVGVDRWATTWTPCLMTWWWLLLRFASRNMLFTTALP